MVAIFGNDQSSRIQFSDEFTRDGAALFHACAAHGLEGINLEAEVLTLPEW
jgi:ATP-dependent DNA ligase